MAREVLLDDEGYHVELTEEGFFFVTLKGDHDKSSIVAYYEKIWPLLEKHAPLLFLNDLSQVGELSLSARWYVAQKIKMQRPLIKRSAVFGASALVRASGAVVARVSGRSDVRIFETREEAEAWLREGG